MVHLLSKFIGRKGGELIMEDVKIKLAVLWLFAAITTYQIRIYQIVYDRVAPELIYVFSIAFFWLPLMMVVLSIFLKEKTNRLANISMGIYFAIVCLVALYFHAFVMADEGNLPYLILTDVAALLASVMIFRLSWKWK